jgi:hypothetical protein
MLGATMFLVGIGSDACLFGAWNTHGPNNALALASLAQSLVSAVLLLHAHWSTILLPVAYGCRLYLMFPALCSCVQAMILSVLVLCRDRSLTAPTS